MRNRRRSNRVNPSSLTTHKHTTSVVKGVVHSVDTRRWVCTVIPIGGGIPIEDIPIAPQSVGADGQGSFYMPEVNSPVWLCRPSDESTPFIMAGATLPTQLDSDDDEEDPTDHRMNRPVLGQGDRMMAGPGGSPFVILRKGGSLEIGASQTAQRIYLPLQDTIREFFSNLEMNAAGGKLSWSSRTDDASHGSEKDPVEFRFQLKEFSDEDPMIDIGMGRIKDADLQTLPGGVPGDVVARLLINDAFQVWIDKEGNAQRVLDGMDFSSIGGKKVDFVASDWVMVVRGNESRTVGSRTLTINGADTVTTVAGKTESIGGDLQQTVEGVVNKTTGAVTEEIRGSIRRNIQGALSDDVTGPVDESYADDHFTTVGNNNKVAVAGRREVTVTNRNFPLGSITGDSLTINLGNLLRHAVSGTIKLVAGPSALAPLAEIRVNALGLVAIRGPGGVQEVQVNSTGVRMKTPVGEVSLDMSGRVKLGPGSRGNVVTTLSHPVCFVTGAPIMGTPFVTAGGAPYAPGPDAVPSTFINQVVL